LLLVGAVKMLVQQETNCLVVLLSGDPVRMRWDR